MKCFCGKNQLFSLCCEVYHQSPGTAPDPETLMRSRYSAFVNKNINYLLKTHDPQTREQFNPEVNRVWANSVQFTNLEILRSEVNGLKGLVEFKATFEDLKDNKIIVHHEISKFRNQKGIWFYREGKVTES